ncbi:MAG: hypothetical protein J6A83_07395 [Clostridia bacterium]|nr:hypothetical protein [Clostridia bacterium]
MKILIAYTSKHGTTAECATVLADRLTGGNEIDLIDMKCQMPISAEYYDVVILGSSVRMGHISKKVKRYIKDNMEALAEKQTAVFLCCGFPDEFEEYVNTQFPKKFNPSLGYHCFGGELKPEKVKGIEKLMVRAIRKSITEHDFEDATYTGSLPEIIPEHIYLLSDKIMGR